MVESTRLDRVRWEFESLCEHGNIIMNKEAFNELKNIISQFSERETCAGWCGYIEYRVWEDINGSEHLSDLTARERFRINELVKELQGWIMWDDNKHTEVFIPLFEWIEMYDEQKRRKNNNI